MDVLRKNDLFRLLSLRYLKKYFKWMPSYRPFPNIRYQ